MSLHACSLFWVLFEVTYSKLKALILNFHVIKQQKIPDTTILVKNLETLVSVSPSQC